MSSVTVSAPGKLMLLGDHAVVYDRPCLVAAIDRRIKLTARLIDKPVLTLTAPQLDLVGYEKALSEVGTGKIPKAAEYIEHAVAEFMKEYPIKGGLQIDTEAEDIGSKFGFGTSSAATVAAIMALSYLHGLDLNNKAIFELAYKAVLALKGVGSGFDIAAATYGGTLYFVTGGTTIKPLNINPFNLIVAYSGYKADTPTLIRAMRAQAEQYPEIVNALFDASKQIVERGRTDIVSGDFVSLGKLSSIHQGLLAALGVSTPELDSICQVATEAGAYGAKLSGAGGGDCAFAIAPKGKTSTITQALNQAGYETMLVEAGTGGVRVE